MLNITVLLTLLISLCGGQETATSKDNFFYPCESLDNLECIREYFRSSGICTPSRYRDGQPIYIDMQVTYVPRIHVKIVTKDDVLTFYGSKVESFYVNRDTNNLVMSVSFDGINLYSSHTNYYIAQRGHEPIIVKDYVNNTYFSELTAVIPSAGKKGITKATVSAFNTQPIPILNLGPAITNSSIPEVQNAYQGFIDDIPSSVDELLLTKGPFFFFNYLQHYICNFGFEYVGMIVQ